MPRSNRRPQSPKSQREIERVQDLRRGSRTSLIDGDNIYDRNRWRNQRQAGFLEDEGWDE